ncbi:uncharacterized protein [Embiotoca jacksoni]|uniref:uncharacterized protein n=1 Tax=Embiotoca jacksoni TaxID=100190 RepID=UPI00370399CE
MMNNSNGPSLNPFINSKFTMKKETASFNQVMTKASSMRRILQVMQQVAQRGYVRACELLCLSVDSLRCEKAICCSAQSHQPTEDRDKQAQPWNSPSTILIVNISNSTLIDCAIGSDAYPSAVAERQPLMQEAGLFMHGQMRCSCSCGQQGAAETAPPPPPTPPPPLPPPAAEQLTISIHSSHLNCVIIGDNNYLHAEQSELD